MGIEIKSFFLQSNYLKTNILKKIGFLSNCCNYVVKHQNSYYYNTTCIVLL